MTESPRRQEAPDSSKDFEAYQMLLNLWTQENPIKTNKLQVLLAVNGLLVSAASVGAPFSPEKWPVYLAGAVFSLIWVLSIGRTALYQDLWQAKLRGLRDAHAGDPRFSVLDVDKTKGHPLLRILGGVSSRWYLVFSPLVMAVVWALVLIDAWM